MLRIDIIAAGRVKSGPYRSLWDEYEKRLTGCKLRLIEIESRHTDPVSAQQDEQNKIVEQIDPSAYVIAMDERGKPMRSLDFAKKLEDLETHGGGHVQFIIGGADGLLDAVRGRAQLLLNFGVQTWPHRLVRVMLLEQIYRAQQIRNRHPYHRE